MSAETSNSGSLPPIVKADYLRLSWKRHGDVMIAETPLGSFCAAEGDDGKTYLVDPRFMDVAAGPFENMEQLDKFAYDNVKKSAKELNRKLKPYLE